MADISQQGVEPTKWVNNEERITYFATTDARNKRVPFGIKAKDRTKHFYVIGKTGMGKSTLLENMAVQDIKNGEGLAFIDPHGGTAEKLLDYIPKERIKDVLYFAPFDMEYPISFNVMEDVGADKRHLVVNGLMSTFEKIWVDAWSARMAYILNNTLLALLEFPNSTLLGVNRMLADKEYRKAIIANISDPSVKSFWIDEFGKYTERFAAEATPAIQNKIGQFTSNPLIRNIIGQPKSAFDIRKMMDERKIIIINLSKGRVGEGNANLLGSMLITRIYLAAMSRADVPAREMEKLPNFYLYVDEFQSFANKSFENILSEARKYKLNLTIAHQYVEQMEEEVRDAVFGNVGTTVAFRVGPLDAELLEKIFMPQFMVQDIVNLGFAQIYLSLMIDGVGSPPFSAETLPPIAPPIISYRDQIIASSREQFGRPRAKIEEEIKKWHEPVVPAGPTYAEERPRFDRGERPRTPAPHPMGQRPVPMPRREDEAPREPLPPYSRLARSAPPQPEPRPPQPQMSVPPRPQPVREPGALKESLSEIIKKNPQVNKNKEATPERRDELKSALAEILKKNTPPASPKLPPPPQPQIPKPQASAETSPPAPPLSTPSSKPKEVPEEVLRKVLDSE